MVLNSSISRSLAGPNSRKVIQTIEELTAIIELLSSVDSDGQLMSPGPGDTTVLYGSVLPVILAAQKHVTELATTFNFDAPKLTNRRQVITDYSVDGQHKKAVHLVSGEELVQAISIRFKRLTSLFDSLLETAELQEFIELCDACSVTSSQHIYKLQEGSPLTQVRPTTFDRFCGGSKRLAR